MQVKKKKWCSQLTPSTIRGNNLFLTLLRWFQVLLSMYQKIIYFRKTCDSVLGDSSDMATAQSQIQTNYQMIPQKKVWTNLWGYYKIQCRKFPCFLHFCLFFSFGIASNWEKHLSWYEILTKCRDPLKMISTSSLLEGILNYLTQRKLHFYHLAWKYLISGTVYFPKPNCTVRGTTNICFCFCF